MKLIVYSFKRLLYFLPILVSLIAIGFFLFYLIPADPVQLIAGPYATPEQIEKVREEYGLDKPLLIQFGRYLLRFLWGDLGTSIYTHRSIMEDLITRAPATLELGFVSLLGSILLGIPIGVLVALRRNSWADHICRAVTIGGLAVASFWLGIMFQLYFGYHLDLFPIGGRMSPGILLNQVTGFFLLDALLTLNMKAFFDILLHLILPAATLGLPCFATIVRFTRGGVLDALRSDYVIYERAMGLSRFVLVFKYILRNAITVPIVQIGLLIGYTIAGAIVVEKVFAWPGVGNFAATSIMMFDYNAILGFTVWSGIAFCLGTLLADIALAIVDPREASR
ncbi:MAG: ABC transporter permease [Thermodesulfobacteriota bacterium]